MSQDQSVSQKSKQPDFCTAYRESRKMGEGRVASILVGFIILAEISVELNAEDE